MNLRILTTAALAAVAVVSASSAAFAAPDKMGHDSKMMGDKKMAGAHGKKMGGKMMAGGVYVCKMCKAYTNAAHAKKMRMMDPMGHKLVMMKKAPAGYKLMSAMMHGGGMMGGKMDHSKMKGNGKM